MKIGFIGLGRMGKNMVYNLLDHKHEIVVHNRSPDPIKEAAEKGALPAYTIEELFEKLKDQKTKIIWLMVTAGKPTDEFISKITPHLKKGDIIIEGGNSYFEDSIRRYEELKKKEISFLDCGTSGGIEGARHGACMMVGGDKDAFRKAEQIFKDSCVKDGYAYMGSTGAGHFVKMVHNGIEYGMMSAIAEGFEAIKKHKDRFGTDLKEVAKVYSHGSIIQGRLMSWLEDSYNTEGYLEAISCEVPKGETEDEMEKLEKLAYMPVLNNARMMRVESRQGKVCGTIISALRNQFGGHAVIKK